MPLLYPISAVSIPGVVDVMEGKRGQIRSSLEYPDSIQIVSRGF